MKRTTISKGARRGHRPNKQPTSTIRVPTALVSRIDVWAGENDAQTRTEAVCQLIERSLAQPYTKVAANRQQARAANLAGRQIDRMGDASVTHGERATRKRRLTEGPSIFRNVRRDKSRPSKS
jgi:hypothetical protein